MQEHRIDVLAPAGALAWVAARDDGPGFWSYSTVEVLDALAEGRVVLSVDRDAEGAPGWVHAVTGTVPFGDYLSIAAELEEALRALQVRRGWAA